MKRIFFISSLLIVGYYNQLFTAYACLNNTLVSIDQEPREKLLGFLGLLDTAIKTADCASMAVCVDNQKVACGSMLAAITDKINKSQLLSSDEVEYGYVIADGLVNIYMPYFYSKKESERTEEYTRLHKLGQQLNAQTLIDKKYELLYQFEQPVNSYESDEIERSPSAKVVNFLWQILNAQNKLFNFYLPIEEKVVSFDEFCIRLYNEILVQQKIESKDLLYFISTYTTVLNNFKRSKQLEDMKVYLDLLHRKRLLEQFKQVNT